MEQNKNIKKRVIDWFDRSTPALTKVMGVMLIYYATMTFYSAYTIKEGNVGWNDSLSVIFLMIFATLILVDLKSHINRAIGLYAFAIATNRILKYGEYLNPPQGIVFVFSLVMIGMAVNLLITGMSFINSTARGRGSMIATTTIMLTLTAGSLLYTMKNGFFGMPPLSIEDVIHYTPDTLALIVLYIMLLCMLSTDTIRKSSKGEKNNRVMNMIRLTDACGSTSYITRSDAVTLSNAFSDRSAWMKYNDHGPVESEFKFRIIHDIDDYSYVTVQKWKGSERLYFTISDHDKGSILNAYRFYSDQIKILDEGKTLVMFNNDGMITRMSINDNAEAGN